MRRASRSHRNRSQPPPTRRSPAPLTAAALGTVLVAGAVFTAAAGTPSTPGVHLVALTVPADITDGGGSGGCQPGAPCMPSPGMPMTPGGSSSGGVTGSDAASTNTAPALPVPGSDPAEIESHQAKPDVGDGGGKPALTPTPSTADPTATADGSPAPVPVPVTTPSGANAGGGAATSGGTSSGGTSSGGTSSGESTGGGESVSPNQALDLVAIILGAVSKLISSLFG